MPSVLEVARGNPKYAWRGWEFIVQPPQKIHGIFVGARCGPVAWGARDKPIADKVELSLSILMPMVLSMLMPILKPMPFSMLSSVLSSIRLPIAIPMLFSMLMPILGTVPKKLFGELSLEG